MSNWTVADYTNDDGITWVFDADGRTVAGAYSREVAELIAKAPGLAAKNTELLNLIADLADDDPCRLDHLGYCQTHNWMSRTKCSHARAQEILAKEEA